MGTNEITPELASRVLAHLEQSEYIGPDGGLSAIFTVRDAVNNWAADVSAAEFVERLSRIAWAASQQAAYDKSHESDENPPILIEWQDRADDDREFTRAGVRALLADVESAGRLIPEGGQIINGLIDCRESYTLTIEEFADLHNAIWEGRGDLSSRDRLREKFPLDIPAETDWPTWQEVPEGMTVKAKNRHTYTKRDGILCIGTSTMKSCMATSTHHLAPFVAAEERES